MEAYPESNNVNLSCEFSTQSCPSSPPRILWFRYLAHTHEDLCNSTCRNSVKFKVHLPSQHQALLQIDKLSVEDSAIYYCGVAIQDSNSATSKTTGNGTLLVVRGWFNLKMFRFYLIACLSQKSRIAPVYNYRTVYICYVLLPGQLKVEAEIFCLHVKSLL